MGDDGSDVPYGPALHVVLASPANGDGVSCPGASTACGVPRDTKLLFGFDRQLLPGSATRQALRLYTGTPQNGGPFLEPQYDLLRNELVYRMTGWLAPRALYQIELLEPADRHADGLRAFDGAPIAAGPGPLEWSFRTATADPAPAPSSTPLADPTCSEIVELLRPSCAGTCCHGAERPALGLRLDSEDALVSTAIGRVALQTDSSSALGQSYVDPDRFGMGMPILDPRSPLTSYLVYKLLIDPRNLAACAGGCGRFNDASARTCVALPESERDALRDWFIGGQPMPPPEGTALGGDCPPAPAPRPLDCGVLRALVRFIEIGAPCP